MTNCKAALKFTVGSKVFAIRMAAMAIVLAAICCGPCIALAATDTWTGLGAGSNWKTALNWNSATGNAPPIPGDILAFDGTNRFLTNNDFPSGTIFGGLIFNATSAGPFTLNGASIGLNGDIVDNSPSYTDTVALNLALQASPTISVVSLGSLSISSAISGTGFGFTQTGGGTLTLSGTNTFTGPITLNDGVLSVSAANNLGAATATSPLRIDGGTLRATSSFTIPTVRPIVLGPASGTGAGTIDTPTGIAVIYGGVISDNGAAGAGTLNKLRFGTLTLTGQNTYTGPTNVKNGGLTLNFSAAGADQQHYCVSFRFNSRWSHCRYWSEQQCHANYDGEYYHRQHSIVCGHKH